MNCSAFRVRGGGDNYRALFKLRHDRNRLQTDRNLTVSTPNKASKVIVKVQKSLHAIAQWLARYPGVIDAAGK
jgi:hypothetical protein